MFHDLIIRDEVSDAANVSIDVLLDPKIYVGNIAFRNKHYIIGLDINVLTQIYTLHCLFDVYGNQKGIIVSIRRTMITSLVRAVSLNPLAKKIASRMEVGPTISTASRHCHLPSHKHFLSSKRIHCDGNLGLLKVFGIALGKQICESDG